MTPTPRLATLAAALAFLLAGCTLFDSRTLNLSIFDAKQTDQRLAINVASTGIDSVRLYVDGGPIGAFPANGIVTIDTSRLVQGEHVVTAQAVAGRPTRSASLRFQVVVPPPRVIRVDPPYGAVAGDAPLTIVVEFSEPVDFDDPVQPFGLTWSGTGRLSAERTVASDGRSIRFLVADHSLLDGLALRGLVRARGGSPLQFNGSLGWTVNWFQAGFLGLEYETHVNGVMRLYPRLEIGTAPPSAEIVVDGQGVAVLGPPPWGPVDLDTASMPEGRHVVSLRASGYAVRSQWSWPALLVDRTAPTGSCRGRTRQQGEPAELGLKECVRVRFNELADPHGGDLQLIDDGVPIPAEPTTFLADSPYSTAGVNEAVVCPTAARKPGAVEQVVAASVTDLAGNPLPTPVCTLSVPSLLTPFGGGPLTDRGSELRGTGLSVTNWEMEWRNGQPWWAASVALVGVLGFGTDTFLVSELWGLEPNRQTIRYGAAGITYSHPSISDERMVVTARADSGSGDVIPYAWSWNGLWAAATAPIDLVAANDADEPIIRSNPGVAVWTEGPTGGVRSLQGAAALQAHDTWTPLTGEPRASTGASVSHPALYVHHPASPPNVALVAFLETAPAGAPRLHAASVELGGGSWIPAVGDLDLGLGTPSEPAVVMAGDLPAVAWIEAGQVRLRMGTLDAAGLAFGLALALNHDPGRPARAARLVASLGSRATLLFVEAGLAGDELWARRWDGTDWILQPGPINAGTGDVIQELAADGVSDAQAVVAWTDASGRVYLRVLNW